MKNRRRTGLCSPGEEYAQFGSLSGSLFGSLLGSLLGAFAARRLPLKGRSNGAAVPFG